MKLEDALKLSRPTQCLGRKEWLKNGSLMRLISSAETIEELNIELTPESLNADDWDIYEMVV
jgi:hypothetical protein